MQIRHSWRPPSAEIAVVGNDGAIGVALFMGGETTTNRAIVQSAGSAYRLTGSRLKQEFERHGEMLHILLRYSQTSRPSPAGLFTTGDLLRVAIGQARHALGASLRHRPAATTLRSRITCWKRCPKAYRDVST